MVKQTVKRTEKKGEIGKEQYPLSQVRQGMV